MKKLTFILLALAIGHTAPAQKISAKTAADFKKLNWLSATWARTNTKPGMAGNERWWKSSATELAGLGITLKGKDTVYVEKLKIVIKDDAIWYVADVQENKEPVYFKLTSITGTSFICENPQHDFPKKISYQLEGNKINASISGNGKTIPYLFEKKL